MLPDQNTETTMRTMKRKTRCVIQIGAYLLYIQLGQDNIFYN